jgi:ankyrin repeat protein
MQGCYPLHQAAQNGHEDSVRFLASIGVDLGTLDCTVG